MARGAGKTTTVRILGTLTRPDGGWARIAGFDVGTQPWQVREVIALTGQYAAVDAQQTGRENLTMIGRLLRLGRRGAATRAAALWTGSTSPRPPTGASSPTRAGCGDASTSQ